MKSLLIKDTTVITFFVLLSHKKSETRVISQFLLLAFVNLISLSVFAQNETRRWAIDVNIGPTFIKNKTGVHDALGVDNGSVTSLGVEYYIPDSHFSTRMGYKTETLNIIAQDVQAEHTQFTLGGRWYPAPEKWMIQPRAGVNVDFLLSSDNTSFITHTIGQYSYSYDASVRSPKVAFAPTVGFDLYIFSSVAFTVDYSYNLGINSKYEVFEGSSNRSQLITKGNLNHHNLNLGIKVTFPFHFNSDDANNLLESLFLSSYERAITKNQKHRRNL